MQKKPTSLLEFEVRSYWRAGVELRAKIQNGATLMDCLELMDDLDLLAEMTDNARLRKLAQTAMLTVPLPQPADAAAV